MVRLRDDLSSLAPKDILSAIGVAMAVALLLKIFVLGAFMIPSHSMENTLLPGDYILVNKLAYKTDTISRGDIVVFSLPQHAQGAQTNDLLIKRVVALPGDTLSIRKEYVFVNGTRIPNPPLSVHTQPLMDSAADSTIVVDDGCVFVMGDNRANSYDSRYWGVLPTRNIAGAPLFIYWSSGKTGDDTQNHIRWERIFEGVH